MPVRLFHCAMTVPRLPSVNMLPRRGPVKELPYSRTSVSRLPLPARLGSVPVRLRVCVCVCGGGLHS
mgnify:CR=1 FL=1